MSEYRGYYTQSGQNYKSQFKVTKLEKDKLSGTGNDEGGDFIIEGKLSPSGVHELHKKYNGGPDIIMRGKTEKKGEEIKMFYGIWELPDEDSGDYKYDKY